MLTSSQVRKPINLEITLRTSIRAVLGNDKTVRAQRLASVTTEYVGLNQHLIVAAGVDGLVVEVLVEVVEDVLVAKAACGTASTLVAPVVVARREGYDPSAYVSHQTREACCLRQTTWLSRENGSSYAL